MLRKEGGDTTIEASGPCIQIIRFGFFPRLSFFGHFTTTRVTERKETKMSHVCRMNNGQGSWCYVIYLFIYFLPSTSLVVSVLFIILL